MFEVDFSFTREPSTKISLQIVSQGLVAADNTVVLFGKRAASGGTATTGAPVTIENMGNTDALTTEVTGLFGSSTCEISEMILAANNALKFTDLDPLLSPPIKAVCIANDATDITSTLAALESLPMPFAAMGFPTTDATNLAAFKAHMMAISKSDRGSAGQFGSAGFVHAAGSLGTLSPIGEGVARPEIVLPWLRDSAGTAANKSHMVAAAVCAICAANIIPFKPLNDIIVGGLVAPASRADWHTPGDSGTVASGLAAGLLPLTVSPGGNVLISRTVTASRRVSSVADADYFDLQDWQVLYYLRKNIYSLTQQATFKRCKGSAKKANQLKSGIISILKDCEALEMLQNVDLLVDQVTVKRSLVNRSAFIYTVPVNVIPGFHNKGVGLIGTTLFDGVVA